MPDHSSSAKGQYLGYSLQLSRLLALLLEGRKSAAVSLELLGDLSVEDEEGLSRLEELKSRTSDANPIADRATDLWKTMRNWVHLIQAGVDPAYTEFRLHTTRHFPSNFAARFDHVEGRDESEQLADEVLAFFTENPPGETLAPFVTPVLAIRRHFCSLIMAFRLSHGSGSSEDDLVTLLGRTVVPEEHLMDVLKSLLGWLKLVTDGQLERRETAVISVRDLHAELIATVRKLDRAAVLHSYSRDPALAEVETQLKTRTYVRQLELVGEDDVLKLRAVRDFLRAKADRIQWASRTLVHHTSLKDLESELEAAWINKKAIVNVRESGRIEEERGRLLLHECLQHRCRIQGMEPPPYFTAGAFHALADGMTVGWHPRYAEILVSGLDEAGS